MGQEANPSRDKLGTGRFKWTLSAAHHTAARYRAIQATLSIMMLAYRPIAPIAANPDKK